MKNICNCVKTIVVELIKVLSVINNYGLFFRFWNYLIQHWISKITESVGISINWAFVISVNYRGIVYRS